MLCCAVAVSMPAAASLPSSLKTDGEGWDHEGKHWTNEPETIGHGPLGIQNDYAMTEGLRKVMGLYGGDYAKNAYPIRDNTQTVLRNFQTYRDFYFNEFQRKENTLTYAFWYYGMCCDDVWGVMGWDGMSE